MKTEEEIRERKIFLEGYISGQRNSHAPYDKEIERAVYELNAINWALDYCTPDIQELKENENG